MRHTPALAALLIALVIGGVAPSVASAEERLTFKHGPLVITPGQNDNLYVGTDAKPKVPGWITYFRPDLVDKQGRSTRTDIIHLHHAVWISNLRPLFAAGEEKTIIDLPKGFGWRYDPKDPWILNHMLHNLTPTAAEVFVKYELGFVPDTDPAAASMKEVKTQWLDVMGFMPYPVFDVLKGQGGKDKRYTYPDEGPLKRTTGPKYEAHRWTVTEPGAMIRTIAHVHPGGLYTDLKVTRGGKTVTVFRSEAKYFEPAGPVSWDMSMTRTPDNWRIALKVGDVVSVHSTYDTSRASWYESMGIMPIAWSPGEAGTDPFAGGYSTRGPVTHGPLAENRVHGGEPFPLPNPKDLPTGQDAGAAGVKINGFVYGRGDLNGVGTAGHPPAVRAGQSLRFFNGDAKKNVMHTITSCALPCNRSTGVAYPIADGPLTFDSGNLGFGPPNISPAANTDRWRTPKSLKPGTYAYFCRVHPFMRGAFRVKKK